MSSIMAHVLLRLASSDSWESREAAAKKPKPKKPREPEEVWYDVHKHPAGVPGGMGLSPEHHLRNRGWNGHEINEGSGKKTIQYRNHKHPDFVISYGGGTSTKPDHNFRVLYMGGNRNIPKVTRGHSLAEAMNKVEELQKLEGGLIVQPMTHDSAASVATLPNVSQQKTFVAPKLPPSRVDMTDDNEHPIGPPKITYPTTVDREVDHPKKPPKQKPQVKQIPDPPKLDPIKPDTYAVQKKALLLKMAQGESWEEPRDYYHGTMAEDLDEVSPASHHGQGTVFPNETDPDYAYASPSESNAWHYAELAWNKGGSGVPKVYRVRPTGPIEEDPTHRDGVSRGNFSDDVRSRHPFEVHEQMPTPEHWLEDGEDW